MPCDAIYHALCDAEITGVIVHLGRAAVCSKLAADPTSQSSFAASRRWQGRGFIVVSLVKLLSLVDIGDTWYTSVLVKRITHEP